MPRRRHLPADAAGPPGGPALSVVVPSVTGWGDLEGCLAALAVQDAGVPIEILVADRVGAAVRGPLLERFPAVRLLEAARGTTIPDLRAMAFAAARGAVVGVIEDHVLVPPDWARLMLAEHAAGAEVVGGAVANAATARLVDRAAFLCEYSHCLAPAEGPAAWVVGNNVTYRRALLAAHEAAWRAGRWEDHLHDALRRDGVVLVSRPAIVVRHRMHYTVESYLSQRFLYSRSWTGLRARGASPLRRALMGVVSLALPPLLLGRIIRNVRASGRHAGELAPALPLLLLFVTAWAAGDAAGWWAGPGDALARVA